MPTSTKTADAETEFRSKATLPINHPRAGYVAPDQSYVDGREPPTDEDLPDDLRVLVHPGETPPAPREERIAQREEELKSVADSEEKAVKEQRKAEEDWAKKTAKAREAQIEKGLAAGIIPAAPPPAEVSSSSESTSKS